MHEGRHWIKAEIEYYIRILGLAPGNEAPMQNQVGMHEDLHMRRVMYATYLFSRMAGRMKLNEREAEFSMQFGPIYMKLCPSHSGST